MHRSIRQHRRRFLKLKGVVAHLLQITRLGSQTVLQTYSSPNLHIFVQGLLLLLLSMAASDIPGVQARPIDFVCDGHARRDLNTVKELESGMGECSGSALLPLPITLPCMKTHKASWDRKSVQQKRGDIVAALRALAQGVREGEDDSLVAACPGHPTRNLGDVFWSFSRLLTGKLEWLAAELSAGCHAEGKTSNL
ncbi:thrombopoietin isoform X2 [Anguilla anguilla]|uniref:thrombopoietin isoform X2 n=1 Tax=Anguilla anguilla TaxID=7936 RepID=UPI0015A7F779|nr:thrombopoietin isoform X2 [Anguilla anguilla]